MKFKENGRGTNCGKGGLCRALWMVSGPKGTVGSALDGPGGPT